MNGSAARAKRRRTAAGPTVKPDGVIPERVEVLMEES